MPLYVYSCIKCDHEFELMQKMNASNPECPECRGETRKQVSAPNFKLKGGGWGVDGYHNPNKK